MPRSEGWASRLIGARAVAIPFGACCSGQVAPNGNKPTAICSNKPDSQSIFGLTVQ
jgi:hypothetical protein